MFKYEQHSVGVGEEPILPHITERFKEPLAPIEEEVRYLGNAWNYCGFFHKELKDCVEEGITKSDKFLFKACKQNLENLHHCYT